MQTRGDYEREWTERQEQWEMAETAEANRRAAALLDRFLTPAQKKTWNRIDAHIGPPKQLNRYFHLTSQHRRKLVICRGFNFNVLQLSDGAYRQAYCAGPKNVPLDDFILAQLLLLKYDERSFFIAANMDACYLPATNFPSA